MKNVKRTKKSSTSQALEEFSIRVASKRAAMLDEIVEHSMSRVEKLLFRLKFWWLIRLIWRYKICFKKDITEIYKQGVLIGFVEIQVLPTKIVLTRAYL